MPQGKRVDNRLFFYKLGINISVIPGTTASLPQYAPPQYCYDWAQNARDLLAYWIVLPSYGPMLPVSENL